MSNIYDWSLKADENAHSDSIINWAEGQPPSSVNDSARAMMQRVREYLADSGGSIDTNFVVNTSAKTTLITLKTVSPIKKYNDDIVIRFKARGVNIGTTTVTVNNIGEKLIYKATYAGILPLEGGELQTGGIYEIVYNKSVLIKEHEGWYLLNPTPPKIENFPAGFIATFATQNVPHGWLLCDGKTYRCEDYPQLFKAIGDQWGKESSVTFKVPDFRGIFLRGFDAGRGLDRGREFADLQQDSIKSHTHIGKIETAGEHTHKFKYQTVGFAVGDIGRSSDYYSFNETLRGITDTSGAHTHKVTLSQTGEEETRPVNTTVVYAIKS
ncbi:microcystin-dependent protein [Bartonella fuyuanensis]|uniref:Microcystin-dependent protein n=1 Tax=Bartonella fuyuanensis TaxID=1460968 RepID=A0A840DWL4_9HYPH|nr:phage tail protein [Bartonella fuyuanensis]MBB4076043.1 microcystin-dependent protein [Bartonella fuyuanensis]